MLLAWQLVASTHRHPWHTSRTGGQPTENSLDVLDPKVMQILDSSRKLHVEAHLQNAVVVDLSPEEKAMEG